MDYIYIYIASHLTHFMPIQIKFYPSKGRVDGWLAKDLLETFKKTQEDVSIEAIKTVIDSTLV